jgi:hypothetical protein
MLGVNDVSDMLLLLEETDSFAFAAGQNPPGIT